MPGDQEDSVPSTHGLQLLAGLASPTPVPQAPSSTAPTPGTSGDVGTSSGQNKVTIGVQQVSDMIQGKTFKQGGQTFYITSPAAAEKPVQLRTTGDNKPYLIQTSGGVVTAVQPGHTGQKLILTGKTILQSPSSIGTSILTSLPTTSTVQTIGKPVMVTQQNQGQIKLVTKTSPVQHGKSPQPVKLQLQVKDATILQKLQQAGQVMTIRGQGGQGETKQPVRLVLPGSSATSPNTGQIQLIQTQQGVHKVITMQQPQQQQQTLKLSPTPNKSPVQFAVVPQAGTGGTGTRLVVVSQPNTSTGTAVPTSSPTKSPVLNQSGTIRIVLPPQAQSGSTSKATEIKTTAPLTAQNVYQILSNQKIQIPRSSSINPVQPGQMKIISSNVGGTAKTTPGQTCIIVPSSVANGAKPITITSSSPSTGATNVAAINKLSPIRQGNTVVHIVSGAGGQQIARVLTTSANTAMQQKPGVQTVHVVPPSKIGVSKSIPGATVQFITTTGAVGFKQVTTSGQNITAKAVTLSPTITTQSLTTIATAVPQKSTVSQKTISFTSVLPKTSSPKEKTVSSMVTASTSSAPGVASTSGAGTVGQQQKILRILPTKPGQKPTQLVILVNQTAANIGEEVKEIGESFSCSFIKLKEIEKQRNVI